MMSRVPVTVRGFEQIQAELKELKSVLRPKITAAIAEARAHGDLKENAEYHAAKEQQGLNEGRIRHLESIVAAAQVIDVTLLDNDGKVVFGATVDLVNLDTDVSVRYQIVSPEEANLKDGRISIGSPLARSLIGKFEGDEVEVKAPNGDTIYEIVKVHYI